MATSGDLKGKSYRGGHRLAAVLVLACLAVASCQSGLSPARGSRRLSRTESAGAKKTWCEAKPDTAWEKVLDGGLVRLSRRASVIPMALANDGRSFFAEIYTKDYSGVAKIDAASSRYTKIKRFPDPVNDQARGRFDGRWLVWAEYHSLYTPGDFTVWSWDSRTGLLRKIGAATRSPGGGFWDSSLQAPVALGGYATWGQGVGPNNLDDIHVVDLARGRDRVVRRGHSEGPFLIAGPLVVWAESMKRGALTVMRAASAVTGRFVATPPALRGLRGGLVPASDGEAVVYITGYWKSLWWAPSLGVKPRRVLNSPDGYTIDNSLQVAGNFVFFSIQPARYFANAASGRYIEIGQGGFARLDARSLVFFKLPAKKADHPISDVVFLSLKSLPPIPPCK